VKAIVLVGGQGTRLRPLTDTTPKQMLPVAGVPMLERVLAYLAEAGIDEVILSLGYRPDAFRTAYPGGTAAGMPLSYAIEPELLDTAGAIAFAAGHGALTETFVVVNGDILTDLDLPALVAFHREREAAATIGLTPVDDPSRFGVVQTDADGRVDAFIEKPDRDDAPTNLINAGIYVFEPEVAGAIPAGRRVSVERETFPDLAGKGRLFASPSDAYWLDTGTPDAYLRAQWALLDGSRGSGPRGGAVEATPGVWFVGTPAVSGHVEAWSLVGDGAVIGSGARVACSVLGDGVVVEDGATVSDSVLLAGARVASGARVDRSVVGFGAVISKGCSVTELSLVGDRATLEPGARLVGGRLPEATEVSR
jgi:mannose-1-phosphate guanylyltransferase